MEMSADQLRALGENGATILNVGRHAGKAEIRGAVRYRPHDLLTPEKLALPLAPDRPVVLYDERGDGDALNTIADRLRKNGFADVRILTGGFAAWQKAGGATQEPSMEQVVPPQNPSEVQQLDRRL